MADTNVERLLEILCCPATRTRKRQISLLRQQGGALVSDAGKRYPVIEGVPDLRIDAEDSQHSANSYTEIHGGFRSIPLPDQAEIARQIELYDLHEGLVRDKTILLAGTGMGLQLPPLLALNPHLIVALDYSANIRQVRKQYGEHENILWVQGDLMNLPFIEETFDLCFNSGVMQQVRSPELAFREMYAATKRGGAISIGSIYDKSAKHRLVNTGRLFHQFDKMTYEEAYRRLSRLVRQRRFFSKLRLVWIHYRLTGRFVVPFTHAVSFDYQMDQTMDWYFPEHRHLLELGDIKTWYNELGMEGFSRGARQYIGRKQR